MLTVSSLCSDCGLELAAGDSHADREVRWVAISEHEDPTPWLSNGEVVLTTGYNLDTQRKQRAYVARLAKHGVSALGFGIGFDHEKLPAALLAAAGEHEMPLFEVPYEMPFIAITEQAARRLINEQYDVVTRGSKVHEQLERLVIDGGGLEEITAAIAGAVGGSAEVLDAEPEALDAGALAVPVPGRRGAPPAGWLVVSADRGELGDFERLIARQASIVVGLELMRERVVNETERRLAGDLLADALSGRLDPRSSSAASGRSASAPRRRSWSFRSTTRRPPKRRSRGIWRGSACPRWSRPRRPPAAPCCARSSPPELTMRIGCRAGCAEGADRQPIRTCASRPAEACRSRRFAAPFTRRAARSRRPRFQNGTGAGGGLASGPRRLHAAARASGRRRVAPLLRGPARADRPGEGEYGGELLRSLEAFIENNGNWERAARQLYCHRHTLRYRIRKIEELTGRDLSRATDRIELWLALRARELVDDDRESEAASPDAKRRRRGVVKVGVPTEIKTDEYRVALTPIGVRELAEHGHDVIVQKGAGEGSAISDADYEAQGVTIVPSAEDVWGEAEMVLKVKEPQMPEVEMLRAETTLFTYLHLAPAPELTKGLCDTGAICIAYETVEDEHGRLPLLAPMSEIAGKIATQAGAFMLEKPLGGRGILLGGVPGVAAANVMIIGGGAVGMNAAFIAIGMEADVFVYDKSIDRLRELDTTFGGRASTVFSLDALDRGAPARHRPRDRRRPGPWRAGTSRDHARAARPDEEERGARRRRDRPGRLLRDLQADDAFRSRPTRSTGSSTTAWRTCRARCRSRPRTR